MSPRAGDSFDHHKNYIETLLNGAQEDPGVRTRFLEVVEKETERMVKLVKDLLVLSRLDYKEMQWVKEKTDLGLLLEEILRQVEPACQEKNISLSVMLPTESCQVFLDKDKIRQVVLNLLENAFKFTPAGGEIMVKVFPGNERYICVAVSDTGAGIPPGDQERVFERFYRVDKTRSRDSGGRAWVCPLPSRLLKRMKGPFHWKAGPGRDGSDLCLPFDGKVGNAG